MHIIQQGKKKSKYIIFLIENTLNVTPGKITVF
jgi:hypothetical protein